MLLYNYCISGKKTKRFLVSKQEKTFVLYQIILFDNSCDWDYFISLFSEPCGSLCGVIDRKRSCAGEEAEEETDSEDPRILSGGRGLAGPQEEGTAGGVAFIVGVFYA